MKGVGPAGAFSFEQSLLWNDGIVGGKIRCTRFKWSRGAHVGDKRRQNPARPVRTGATMEVRVTPAQGSALREAFDHLRAGDTLVV